VNWLDLIGWAGSALLVWSLLQTRLLRLRLFNLIGCVVLIFFNAALEVWPMVGLNIVLAIINIVYLRRMLATRHDDQAYAVVEVHPDDAFLTHVLDVYAEDIRRFNPGFKRSGKELAFLVMHADELAGVVLMHDYGAGTAQIELDYVTQRFRDFTPGEFVYQRSGLFTERGFGRVVTPPGMISPYYGRIGFKRVGDVYVLEM
jgi:hypothetical protein